MAQQFEVHPNQIADWKRQLSERAADVFEKSGASKSMHAKIGQLTLENDFFRKRTHQGGVAERKAIIDRGHALAIKRQAELVGISRSSSVYYQPHPVSAADLEIMRHIDELHLEHPFRDPACFGINLTGPVVQWAPQACRHADEAHGR